MSAVLTFFLDCNFRFAQVVAFAVRNIESRPSVLPESVRSLLPRRTTQRPFETALGHRVRRTQEISVYRLFETIFAKVVFEKTHGLSA